MTAVQQDWIAWIPDQSLELFEQIRTELEGSCTALAVLLNEAVQYRPGPASNIDPEMALLFGGLFERLADRLGVVLNALEQHGRDHGIRANASPLRPADFRSPHARLAAHVGQLRQFLPATGYAAFQAKIQAIRWVLSLLREQARHETHAIAAGPTRRMRTHWTHLDVVQDDLNTCLQETTIVLKSFFCAMPVSEVPLFRDRLAV